MRSVRRLQHSLIDSPLLSTWPRVRRDVFSRVFVTVWPFFCLQKGRRDYDVRVDDSASTLSHTSTECVHLPVCVDVLKRSLYSNGTGFQISVNRWEKCWKIQFSVWMAQDCSDSSVIRAFRSTSLGLVSNCNDRKCYIWKDSAGEWNYVKNLSSFDRNRSSIRQPITPRRKCRCPEEAEIEYSDWIYRVMSHNLALEKTRNHRVSLKIAYRTLDTFILFWRREGIRKELGTKYTRPGWGG